MEQADILLRKCEGLQTQLIAVIEILLWAALIVALLSALTEFIAKVQQLFAKPGGFARSAVAPADPVKLLDAIKGVIEALAKAPAWIALLFAAVILLFASRELMPTFCTIAVH